MDAPHDLEDALDRRRALLVEAHSASKLFWTIIWGLMSAASLIATIAGSGRTGGFAALAGAAMVGAVLARCGIHPAMPPSKYDTGHYRQRLAFLDGWIAAERSRCHMEQPVGKQDPLDCGRQHRPD